MPLAARWCRVSGWYLLGLIHYIYNTMAIIRNAANTMMKGRVGQTTYYISKGQQVARQSRNDSNYGETARRTELQQARRVLWANLVDFYKISAMWMPKAFESKRSGQTDYNKFMAVNVPSARIPLTKSEAEAGALVVDGFLVTQGSLPSIEVTQVENAWKTNIQLGALVITAETTVGDVSTAMIENNANIRRGMQLSFVMYQQSVDALGTPRVTCRCYELTVDETSEALLNDHIPALGFSVVDGALGTSSEVPTGAFAWILSELQGGALKVSTQLLINNNATLIQQYTSQTQLTKATQSYGIDGEVILNPDNTVTQEQEPSSPYIQYAIIRAHKRYAGDYAGLVGTLAEVTTFLQLGNMGNLTATAVKLVRIGEQSGVVAYTDGEITFGDVNPVSVAFPTITPDLGNFIGGFYLTMSDGSVLHIPFTVENPDA